MKLENSIIPVHKQTENLQRLQENVEKTLSCLDHVISYYHVAKDTEKIIKEGWVEQIDPAGSFILLDFWDKGGGADSTHPWYAWCHSHSLSLSPVRTGLTFSHFHRAKTAQTALGSLPDLSEVLPQQSPWALVASLFSSAFFPKDFPCPLGLSLHQECTRACLGWDVQFLCFPIRACLERRARLRIVCCSIISISALAVWVGYPAVALSAGRREFHYLLLAEEKGIEIFLVIFILSLVRCFLAILFFFSSSWDTTFYFWFYF